jgi:DNA-directed RNA polymerase subunit M/transcription elongation factor TFIIS
MDAYGPAAESFELAERYRRLSDDEILDLARQESELTDLAREALKNEMSQRRLNPEPAPAPAPEPAGDDESSYDDDRQLVLLTYVWCAEDALQIQKRLELAEVPFFIGPEKATSVDAVKSSFADGLSLQVMKVGVPYARAAIQYYKPVYDPIREAVDKAEIKDVPVRCPKCKSEEVIFDKVVSTINDPADDTAAKFQWTCDSCGYQWEDDGVVKES